RDDHVTGVQTCALPICLRFGVRYGAMDPKQIVHSDPEILGGTPVFAGTRVPVDALIDFLEGGDTIDDFLDNYPGVSREQAVAFRSEERRVGKGGGCGSW